MIQDLLSLPERLLIFLVLSFHGVCLVIYITSVFRYSVLICLFLHKECVLLDA